VVDPKEGFTTWDSYIERLFCPAEHFDVLCKSCHEAKTQIEDVMREHYKNEKDYVPNLKKKVDKPKKESV
jgi:formate-dependent nitrite reductase cytochrome c552 subunit